MPRKLKSVLKQKENQTKYEALTFKVIEHFSNKISLANNLVKTCKQIFHTFAF